jgi:hypothetical protein
LSLGIWLPWIDPARGREEVVGKHASRHGMPCRAAPSVARYRVYLGGNARAGGKESGSLNHED